MLRKSKWAVETRGVLKTGCHKSVKDFSKVKRSKFTWPYPLRGADVPGVSHFSADTTQQNARSAITLAATLEQK